MGKNEAYRCIEETSYPERLIVDSSTTTEAIQCLLSTCSNRGYCLFDCWNEDLEYDPNDRQKLPLRIIHQTTLILVKAARTKGEKEIGLRIY